MKNPYENALDAVWDAHDCKMTGRVTAGDLAGRVSSVTVCDFCRSVGTAYVTASGFTPVEYVAFEKKP